MSIIQVLDVGTRRGIVANLLADPGHELTGVDPCEGMLKKTKNVSIHDPNGVGDVYSLTSTSAESRLLICHHEGGRTIEDAIALFTELEQKRAKSSLLPVFISDDWDAFANALLEVYGIKETPEYKGIGRKPNPVLVPHPDLKYAQVVKNKE